MGKNWTKQEDQILIELVKVHGKQWGVIAQKMGTRTSSQIAARWEKCLDPKLTKGPFTPEEDAVICDYVSQNGPHNWPGLSQLMKNRSAKQCRERWFNHLDPSISSSPWSSNEDALLFDCIMKYGHKWSIISKFVPGRTDNAIKNRWNSSISKRIRVDQNGRRFLTPDLSRRQKGLNQQQNLNVGQVPYSSSTNINYLQDHIPKPGNEQNILMAAPEQKKIQQSPFSAQESISHVPNIQNGSITMNPSFPFPPHNIEQQNNIQQTEPFSQRMISTTQLITSNLPQRTEPILQHNQQQIPVQLPSEFTQPLPSKPIPHFKREAAGMNLQPVITSCPLRAPTPSSVQPQITSPLDKNLYIANNINMADNNAFPQPHLQEPSIPQEQQQPSSPILPFSLFSPHSPLFQFSPIGSSSGFPFGSSGTATPIFSPNGQNVHNSANVFK